MLTPDETARRSAEAMLAGDQASLAAGVELIAVGPGTATGVALTYGVASAVFGGTAPLIATVLVAGDLAWLAPTYVAVAALLGFAAAVTAEETAFGKLS